MPAKRRLTMRQLRQMLRLAGSGTSSREIAVVLGIARSTVQDNLRRAAAIGLSWPLPGELTDDALENKLFARNGVKQGTRRRAEPNWADLAVELKKPGVTLLILWEEYRGSHADGYGYSRFCELFRSFEQRLSPTMRQEHAAGDKVFGKKIPIVDRDTGEIREAEIFVAVLGASSFTYAEATWTQTLPDWIGSHVRMFRFFDGVPRLIVPDNLKSGVNRCQLLRSRDQSQLRHDGIPLWRRRSSGTAATAEGQIESRERRAFRPVMHSGAAAQPDLLLAGRGQCRHSPGTRSHQ